MGTCNVLFFDGHVKNMGRTKIDPCPEQTTPGSSSADDSCCDEEVYHVSWRPRRAAADDSSSDDECSENGLLAEYRRDTWSFDGPPDIQRIDVNLEFPFGKAAGHNVQPGSGAYPFPESRGAVNQDLNGNGYQDVSFSAVWRGYIKADYNDTYVFKILHDDFVWLFVDGQLIARSTTCCHFEWNGWDRALVSDPIQMQADRWVPIEVRLDNRWWAHDHLAIRWQSSSQPLAPIPNENFCTGR
jgi:prepilin-type processing-associated H-X9-DG protein